MKEAQASPETRLALLERDVAMVKRLALAALGALPVLFGVNAYVMIPRALERSELGVMLDRAVTAADEIDARLAAIRQGRVFGDRRFIEISEAMNKNKPPVDSDGLVTLVISHGGPSAPDFSVGIHVVPNGKDKQVGVGHSTAHSGTSISIPVRKGEIWYVGSSDDSRVKDLCEIYWSPLTI